MNLLTDWIRKKLGYHVCEEFTQWRTVEVEKKRVHTRGGVQIGDPVHYIETWQSRECTICGLRQVRQTEV